MIAMQKAILLLKASVSHVSSSGRTIVSFLNEIIIRCPKKYLSENVVDCFVTRCMDEPFLNYL